MQVVDYKLEANRPIIAFATRATISKYRAERDGSLAAIARFRGFNELANEIGQWMGLGRSKVEIERGVTRVTFERGDLVATAPNDLRADRAIDMAYLIWVEGFCQDIARMDRAEFVTVKEFMYRGFTKEKLAELRAHGKNSVDEHIRLWRESETRKKQQEERTQEQARRDQEEVNRTRDRLARTEQQLLDEQQENNRLRSERDKARREVKELTSKLTESSKKLADTQNELKETKDRAASVAQDLEDAQRQLDALEDHKKEVLDKLLEARRELEAIKNQAGSGEYPANSRTEATSAPSTTGNQEIAMVSEAKNQEPGNDFVMVPQMTFSVTSSIGPG